MLHKMGLEACDRCGDIYKDDGCPECPSCSPRKDIVKLSRDDQRNFEVMVLEGLRFLQDNPTQGFGELKDFLELEHNPFSDDGWQVVKAAIASRYLSDVCD